MLQALRLFLLTFTIMMVLSTTLLSLTVEASPVLQGLASLDKRHEETPCGSFAGTTECPHHLKCCYLYPDYGVCLSKCP
ncbi:MAG: hypothetical protein J3R72DRAFT_449964 [Linnemannia gamsii]|nr:MAG: hypothetical protein J3R72DRAFT_449964 [Linnemannia gamsii]